MEGEYSADEETPDVIGFDEIVPGASVRVTKIDGEQYLCVRDLVYGIGGGHIVPRQVQGELSFMVRKWKFPGRNESIQSVILFQGAIKILAWLPIRCAPWHCSKAAEIIITNYTGNKSMLWDVYTISMSKENMSSLEAIPEDQVDHSMARKRKALELEDLKTDLNAKRMDTQTRLMKVYTGLCMDEDIDARGREHFKKVMVIISSAIAGIYPAAVV